MVESHSIVAISRLQLLKCDSAASIFVLERLLDGLRSSNFLGRYEFAECREWTAELRNPILENERFFQCTAGTKRKRTVDGEWTMSRFMLQRGEKYCLCGE